MDSKKWYALVSTLIVCTTTIITLRKFKKKKKKIWAKAWHLRRDEGRGILNMLKLNNELLKEDLAAYQNFLRLNAEQFDKLFKMVESKIAKQDTVMRESVSARSRLEITLRFLATGESFRSLMYSSRIHESTLSKIIPEVCNAIISVLRNNFLKTPTTVQEWNTIAQDFNNMWQFPQCLGALDGRHIKFRPPRSAGSFYYNYKGDHSIVLMAMADAHYKFTYVNVGINGRISDGGIFRECSLSKALFDDTLNLPESQALPGRKKKVPFVVVADDAFPLSERIIKPYPQRNLTYECRIFNYRLSRARRIVENAFGILANRFRVLLNPINLAPNKVETITLACVALHNFLATENWKSYTDIENNQYQHKQYKINNQSSNRPTNLALRIRDEYKDYFCNEGRVEFQDKAVLRYNM